MKGIFRTPESAKAACKQEGEEFEDDDSLVFDENRSQFDEDQCSIISFEIDSNKQHLEVTNQGVVRLMMAVYQNHLDNPILSNGYANQKPPNENLLESVNMDDFVLPVLEKTILLKMNPEDNFYLFLNEIFAEHPTFISQELITIALRVHAMFLSLNDPELEPELLLEFGKNLHSSMNVFLYESLTIFGESMQKSLRPTESKKKVLKMRSQFLEGYCCTILLVLKDYFDNPLFANTHKKVSQQILAENKNEDFPIIRTSEVNLENPSILTLHSFCQQRINEAAHLRSKMEVEKQNAEYLPTETSVPSGSLLVLKQKRASDYSSSSNDF